MVLQFIGGIVDYISSLTLFVTDAGRLLQDFSISSGSTLENRFLMHFCKFPSIAVFDVTAQKMCLGSFNRVFS